MSLDERTSRPLYRQVADELRVQIQERQLAPGRQLPTEARLMDRYGVSRNTIRLALGVLRTEGLVVTGQGRGSFVADVAVRRRPRGSAALQRHIARGDGDPLDSDLSEATDGARVEVSVSTRPAPPFIADRLGLEAGDSVVIRHRLRFRDAGPDLSSESFLPADLVADSPLGMPGPLRAGVVGLLADLGHPIRRIADEIGVRMPSPAEAQELQIATGVPVLTVQRTAFDRGDAPVLTVSALLPGDRHVLRYDAAISTVDEQPVDAG